MMADRGDHAPRGARVPSSETTTSSAGTVGLRPGFNPPDRPETQGRRHFPSVAVDAYRAAGLTGLYFAICSYVLRSVPIAVRTTDVGKIGTAQEAASFLENLCLGELRDRRVEAALRSTGGAVVVDVGVNVGVTCRWWLAQSPGVRVIGVDMFQEALDFTARRLDASAHRRWTGIAGAVGAEAGSVTVNASNPLDGSSSIDAPVAKEGRTVQMDILDRWITSETADRVTLLKLDIEGFGGAALQGATRLLNRCDYVVIETHHDEETELAATVLAAQGFRLYRVFGRNMWWTSSTTAQPSAA